MCYEQATSNEMHFQKAGKPNCVKIFWKANRVMNAHLGTKTGTGDANEDKVDDDDVEGRDEH